MSLCFLCFSLSWGPWGLFAVAKRSQMSHLSEQLTQAGVLKDQKYYKGVMAQSDQKEIGNKIHYLFDRYGLEPFQIWFDEPLEKSLELKGASEGEKKDALLAKLGFDVKVAYLPSFNLNSRIQNESLQVKGYDYLLPVKLDASTGIEDIVVKFEKSKNTIVILKNNHQLADVHLSPLIRSLLKKRKVYTEHTINQKEMNIKITGSGVSLDLQLHHIGGRFMPDSLNVLSLRGMLLLKIHSSMR